MRDGRADLARRFFRHAHLAAPVLAGRPSVAFQVVGDGGEHVGRRGPDVAASVAVEILGELQVAGRHELRLPHRARPGSPHVGELDVAPIEDLERREELAAEQRRAALVPGQGRQSGDGRADAGESAEVGLETPDRDDDFGGDAVVRADFLEQRALLHEPFPRARDEPGRQAPRQISLERQHRFCLRAIALDDDRQRFLNGRQCGVDDLGTYPAHQRFLVNAGQEFGERRPRRLLGWWLLCRGGWWILCGAGGWVLCGSGWRVLRRANGPSRRHRHHHTDGCEG